MACLFQTKPEAERFLSNVNFYRFRGYLEPLIDPLATGPQPPFRQGTDFDTVVERYEFDTQLCALLLAAFNRIEVSLRTQWTYHLSYTLGGGTYCHQQSNLFSTGYPKNWQDLS